MNSVLKLNEPLAPYTTWHIGGVADRYFRPQSIQDLSQFLASLPETEPLTFLGLGSNVLIADAGLRGTLIHMLAMEKGEAGLSVVEETSNEKIIRVEAGVACAKVAKYAAKLGLKGAEFFAGIPGTVGGALAMNAGAFGGETWKFVKSVETIDRQGKLRIRPANEYRVSYRSVIFPAEEWFIAGIFQFEQGDSEIASQNIKQLLQRRNETQPIGTFSAGSTFKNPPQDYVGRLIEASGLKGHRIGGAQISEKHANFILNVDNARAEDVLALMKIIKERVLKDHQVILESEVRLLGF